MLEFKELKRFYDLPPIFNANLLRAVEKVLDEYDAKRADVVRKIDELGSFKDAKTYDEVHNYFIRTSVDYIKYYPIIKHLQKENCKNE